MTCKILTESHDGRLLSWSGARSACVVCNVEMWSVKPLSIVVEITR